MRVLPRLLLLALTAGSTAALTGVAVPASAAAARHTKQIVVRPVHADGRPVQGYTVKKESFPDFTCDAASPVAVNPNIRMCGPSATYTVACWKSRKHTVLCLRNARSKTLYRIRYTGAFHSVAAPRNPRPQVLRLGDRETCLVRDGGAWSVVTGHPQWFGTYGCRTGDVYGKGDGINESVQPWRVHVVTAAGSPQQKIVRRVVRKAYFVGTAA